MSRRPPPIDVSIRNRQRIRPINVTLFRRIVVALLHDHLGISAATLCLHLVDAPEMTRLNEHFLGHEGSTDVITFDHSEDSMAPVESDKTRAPASGAGSKKKRLKSPPPPSPSALHGEIFISIPDAIRQAPDFRATWPSEVVRYAIHGVLHLLGHDDHAPEARRRMKRKERQFLDALAASYRFQRLSPRR